jgi:hypothetical protein
MHLVSYKALYEVEAVAKEIKNRVKCKKYPKRDKQINFQHFPQIQISITSGHLRLILASSYQETFTGWTERRWTHPLGTLGAVIGESSQTISAQGLRLASC